MVVVHSPSALPIRCIGRYLSLIAVHRFPFNFNQTLLRN